MLLTGKAKKDFLVWLYSEYDFTEKTFNELYPENLKEWFIIQWFDSVGIEITIGKYGYSLFDKNRSKFFLDRNSRENSDVNEQAIIKANVYYNNRNNNQD